MMKRFTLYTATLALAFSSVMASPRALYVKESDGIHRYTFGVAGNLKFSEDGKTLYVTGYESGINLSQVEYMTFDMPTDGQMSSTEHKDKIIQIGEKLNSKINANDAADIIGFGAEFSNLDYCDQDEIFAKFEENHPDLFDDDDDYYSRLPQLVEAMAEFGQGNFAAARKVGSVYTELFTRDDFNGVFTVDTNARKWVKTADADYFELSFRGPAQGKEYTFRIETSADYTVWSEAINIKEWNGSTTTYNVTGHAPKTITGTVKMGDTTIFSATVGINLNQDAKSIDITTNANSANVEVNDVIAIRNSSASANLVVKIKGETVITNNVEIKGSQLLNVTEWVEDLQGVLDEYEFEHYNEYYYEVDGRKIARKFGKITTNTDVMGELLVQGHVANYDMSYDDLEYYFDMNDDADSVDVNNDKQTVTYYYGSPYWCDKIADIANNYTDASFYYAGNPQPQGFITWNVYEDSDDYTWTSDGYWDKEADEWVSLGGDYVAQDIDYYVMPYLTFADGSSFAFDSSYFTGSNFNKLVNDAEDIADIINNILSGYEYDQPWEH